MRHTLYLQPEIWDLAREFAAEDGRRESGSPLSVSVFVSRLILAEKRKRSPQLPLTIPGVRAGVMTSGQSSIGNAGYADVAPREPRVQGPILKAEQVKKRAKP